MRLFPPVTATAGIPPPDPRSVNRTRRRSDSGVVALRVVELAAGAEGQHHPQRRHWCLTGAVDEQGDLLQLRTKVIGVELPVAGDVEDGGTALRARAARPCAADRVRLGPKRGVVVDGAVDEQSGRLLGL